MLMKAKFNKLFTLLTILTLAVGQAWAVDYSSLNYNGETSIPSGYKCYGSSTGATCTPAAPSSMTVGVGGASVVCFDVTDNGSGGGSGTYNKRAKEFVITEDCSVEVELYTGNAGRVFSLYNGSSTAVETITLESKKTKYVFTYDFSGATALAPKTYSFSGSGSKVYIAKITFTSSAATAPAITAPTMDQSATYTVGDAISALEVTATGSPAPTYQWYSNTSAATAGATLLTGEESASYTPSNAAASDLYYYCVATNSEGSATSHYFHVTVNAAVATAPSFTSPASEPAAAEYHVGDVISALEVVAAGYPAPTLQWYSNDSKSTTGATLISGAESASYTPSNAAESDLYYYCVASNSEGDAQSEYFQVTVLPALPPCYTFTSTNPAETVTYVVDDVVASAGSGGEMVVTGNTVKNTEYGLSFESSGSAKVTVTMNSLMKVGTVIKATLWSNNTGSARSLKLNNSGSTTKATWSFTPASASGEEKEFSYTVTAGDGLAGSNVFQLQRGSNVYLRSVTVSNCGAELLDLSSAVDPVGKATITLSKNLVEAGGTATATYSAIDAAYDFDEWVISGATIDDHHANPVTITMGSTAATITLKLKTASVKHTVTYYDGASELGTELVEEGSNPTGAGLAPHKLGYTFGGWSTTNGGAAVALNTISVAADMPLYAVWNAVNCATKSGTIYTMEIAVAPAANCTIKTASGFEPTLDLYQYEGIVGGEAMLGNTGSSNNCILQTDKTILLKNNVSYLKLDFDCPLKEGDKIQSNVTGSGKAAYISVADSRPDESGALAILANSTTGEITVPAALNNAQTIYIWKGGGNVTITSINIVRPVKYAVTFNMHDHGDAVDPQYIVEGGKVTEPATTDITGWDFGGWYKESTFENAWDFDIDVVGTSAIELHAKWTAHVLSSDVALGTLSVNDEAITIVPSQTVYNVELPMGTSAIPTVAATAHDANAKACTVTQATAVDGSATVYIKAEDNTTEETYTINFTVATSKDIELVWDKSKKRCDDTTPTANVKSDDASVSAYVNKITFTGGGAEGSSLNVGNTAGNMFTLTAKAGYAFKAMSFFGKIQDATCEYSLDGAAWQTLTSTNTSGDACYSDVFSAAEVHEFRLRSTGASGVWIRNMQLTMIEACTPIVVAWDEEPVEFEVGKAGYAIAATANNGGDITYATADNTIIDVNASTGALTIAGLGSVALSASTPEGDGTTYCANGGDPIVLSKTVNTYYLVTFDGQNGEATDEVKYFSGGAAIAQPTDPSFPGHTFQGWFDAASAGNPVAFPLTPSASRTIYAQWTADCAGATITTQPVGTSYLTGRTATALVCEATPGAAGALTYEWFTCDDAMRTNPVAATATPSTAVAGTFYYFCKVTEEGCAVEAFSDVVTITVADKTPICLIATTVTGATAHGAVTGFLGEDRGGDAEVNVSGGSYKMDKGKYIGVTLPDGYKFQEGDKVVLNVMTVNNATGFALFDGKGGEKNMIIDTRDGALVPAGANTVVLPAYAGSQSVYVLRENNDATGDLNSAIDAIAVYRACAPILNKVTVNGAEGKPNALNQVVFEVAASTSQSQLEAIAFDWVSNDDAWTASHAPVAANAWEFGVANTVTLTDKDGDASVYTVTVNKAAVSTDATLASLTVNGQAVTLVPGQFTYDVELPHGISVAPTVVATANHPAAVATVDPCTLSGATITVVPESGAGDQKVYTLNFTINPWAEVVIWDGSTMTEVATSPIADLAWTVNGFGGISNYNATCGTKAYTKCLKSGGAASASRNVELVVPTGYIAKFYIVVGTHEDGTERGMFIGTAATKTLDASSILEINNSVRTEPSAGTSEIAGAGTWYINPEASVDFYEIRAYLRPGYARTAMLGNGVLGTICVPNNVAVEDIQGATFYELSGKNAEGKIAFDQITTGQLDAGKPYVFQAHGDKLVLYYGATSVGAPVNGNGFYGTFTDSTLTELDDVYYFAQKALWSCTDLTSLSIPANRAYVKLSEIPSAMAPAPGRIRMTLNVNGAPQVTTGMEEITNDQSQMANKVIIDGRLFILRGEKLYDATGKLVK